MLNTARILLLMVIATFIQLPHESLASSCVGRSGRGILSSNASVFAGKVESIEYLETDEPALEPPIRVTFSVQVVWKGPVRDSLVVRTVYNKSSFFGYSFKSGLEYLVAAKTVVRDDPATSTAELEGVYACGETKPLSQAEADLKALGEGQRPAGVAASNQPTLE